MQIHLKAIEPDLVAAWQHHFMGISSVKASLGDILKESADAIVSPANSFGHMDGGLDLKYSQFFGWDLEKSVRKVILNDYHGELPIGQAIIVETGHPSFKYLISAPTMRVPMRVDKTANAYLAFRGVLRAIGHHNETNNIKINSFVCPGLGTGEGCMPFDRCALQMKYAYDVVIKGEILKTGGLAGAVRNHMYLIDEQ